MIGLALVLIATTASADPTALRTLPTVQRAAIQRYADAKLLDGPSTRWKWPPQRKHKLLYCGWLNSKNRMGAYVGWRPFLAMFKPTGAVDSFDVLDPESTTSLIVFDAICKSNGYDIESPPTD